MFLLRRLRWPRMNNISKRITHPETNTVSDINRGRMMDAFDGDGVLGTGK